MVIDRTGHTHIINQPSSKQPPQVQPTTNPFKTMKTSVNQPDKKTMTSKCYSKSPPEPTKADKLVGQQNEVRFNTTNTNSTKPTNRLQRTQSNTPFRQRNLSQSPTLAHTETAKSTQDTAKQHAAAVRRNPRHRVQLSASFRAAPARRSSWKPAARPPPSNEHGRNHVPNFFRCSGLASWPSMSTGVLSTTTREPSLRHSACRRY